MITIINPYDSWDEIESKIKKSDALWLNDHYPGTPTNFSSTDTEIFEKYIQDNPDKIFFFSNCPEMTHLKTSNNVIWLPFFLTYCSFKLSVYKKNHIHIDLHRKNNLVFIGGQDRLNRTITNCWLASNFDRNKIKFTNWKNNNIARLVDLLKSSIIKPLPNLSKQLGDNHESVPSSWSQQDIFFEVLLPKYFSQCNVSIVTEANGYELSSAMTEKSLNAFYSGCFPLWVGSYKIDYYLKLLDFVLYDFIDHSHCSTKNRADLTLLGLENNKHVFSDNEKLNDLRSDYGLEIQHNFKMSTNYQNLIKKFSHEWRLLLDLLKKDNMKTLNGTFNSFFEMLNQNL